MHRNAAFKLSLTVGQPRKVATLTMAKFWVFTCLLVSSGMADPSMSISKNILEKYDEGLRPRCNGTVRVTFDIAVRQIIELDEPKQIVKLNLWIRMKWNDCRLHWNADDYGGMESIVIPASRIWVPDMTLYDRVSRGFEEIGGIRAVVQSDGSVVHNFPALIESSCKMNVKYFPFDRQECKLIFSSWVHDGLQIDVVNKNPQADLSNMATNVEWNVVNVPAVRHVVKYDCCVAPYPDVTYYVELQRKSMYYIFQIIVPCSLISALGILSFILPPESGEKVSVGVTILLSQAVFLMLIGDLLPPSSETLPLIAIYFDFSMVLVGFACLTAVVTLNTFHRKDEDIPNWIRFLSFRILSKIVFVNANSKGVGVSSAAYNNSRIAPFKHGIIKTNKTADVTETGIKSDDAAGATSNSSNNNGNKMPPSGAERHELPSQEWRMLALIIDRVGLALYIVTYFLGTVAFALLFALQ
ncbi:hypothetical protein ScPMuIL_018011 [Solemya velum]